MMIDVKRKMTIKMRPFVYKSESDESRLAIMTSQLID